MKFLVVDPRVLKNSRSLENIKLHKIRITCNLTINKYSYIMMFLFFKELFGDIIHMTYNQQIFLIFLVDITKYAICSMFLVDSFTGFIRSLFVRDLFILIMKKYLISLNTFSYIY